RLDEAHRPLAEAESRMAMRSEWFQGRELAEALRVLVAAAEGRTEDAVSQFEAARALGDPADLYSAAWLTAACAPALLLIDRDLALAAVERYAARVAALGFTALVRQFRELTSTA
ncbi:MAG: hypothetical protein ACRENQ_05785, partial [Gemmatimonadaceae bacterium]